MKWDEANHSAMENDSRNLAHGAWLEMIFPRKYGGAGLGYVEYVIAIEELSRVMDQWAHRGGPQLAAPIIFFLPENGRAA